MREKTTHEKKGKVMSKIYIYGIDDVKETKEQIVVGKSHGGTFITERRVRSENIITPRMHRIVDEDAARKAREAKLLAKKNRLCYNTLARRRHDNTAAKK